MLKKTRNAVCIAASFIAFSGWAQAEEVDIQAVIDSAVPHMHHSCASILETYPDDEEAINKIVREMAFVSLYNREIAVLEVAPEEAESGALRDEFVEQLEAACDGDPGMLLAGAVDIAVMNTMAPFN